MSMYRQGDLLFILTTDSPVGQKKTGKDSTVVLGSTVTGHDHKLVKGEVYVVDRGEVDRWERDRTPNFYITVPNGGTDLVHPEHKTIPLGEGTYKVIRQREVNGYVRD